MPAISINEKGGLIEFKGKKDREISRSSFIERYSGKNVRLYDALWIFSEEIREMTKWEWLEAHTSQPIGKPLHKHRGMIAVESDRLVFYDEDTDDEFSIMLDSIQDLTVGYDDVFRRFQESRGWIPPLHFNFDGRRIYIFTKAPDALIYAGNNESFLNALEIKQGSIH